MFFCLLHSSYANMFEINNMEFNSFKKINTTKYNIVFQNISFVNITFLSNFHSEWKIYLKDKEWFFSKSLFDDTHHVVYDYANGWTISKDEIIKYVDSNYGNELKSQWYPKDLWEGKKDYKYYKLNPDWSIDIELTLYFKPQSYFYLWLIISWSTFLILIGYLWYDFIKRRKS